MPDPITPSGARAFSETSAPGAPPEWTGPPPQRDVSELPDGGSLPRGLPIAALRVVATPVQPAAATTAGANGIDAVARRLDEFMRLATPTFHTSEGSVSVPIPFHMNAGNAGGSPPGAAASRSTVVASAGRRAGLAAEAVGLVVAGRGDPQQVARLAQGLIDGGYLPAPDASGALPMSARVRAMMFSYGVGLDCAGYVQQAFLYAHGLSRGQAGFKRSALENLAGLSGRGFARVQLHDMRPGDLVIFRPVQGGTIGHTAIVRDVHPATAIEIVRLTQSCAVSAATVAAGSWTTFQLDSSWGASNDYSRGGVQRGTLWHDAVTGTWAWQVGPDTGKDALPYGHAIEGIYRRKGK